MLKNCEVLESMIIDNMKWTSKKKKRKLYQKILIFERGSKNCQVKFAWYLSYTFCWTGWIYFCDHSILLRSWLKLMCPNFWWECGLLLGYGPKWQASGLSVGVVKFYVSRVKLFAMMKRGKFISLWISTSSLWNYVNLNEFFYDFVLHIPDFVLCFRSFKIVMLYLNISWYLMKVENFVN